MRIGAIHIPEVVQEALTRNKLVVFAGAGVSIPPPSGLPSFARLAREIGLNAGEHEEDEPLDRYLGRLESDGVQVHRRAQEILLASESEPSALHLSLTKLFAAAGSIRLVTTNYDPHFETAAQTTWPGAQLNVYKAPALPVGSLFKGIVYLHGHLASDPSQLVLTDSDFGRAYLTEGWARRFLSAMFDTYVVIFVGYKHEDVVVQYLARGLPSRASHRRFALTPEGFAASWKHLGIEPIEYDKSDDHGELREALDEWAEIEGRGALDHERRVAEILAGPAEAATDADRDYLLYCIRDPERSHFFFRYATDASWLAWVHDQTLLQPLLAKGGDLEEQHRGLMYWFADLCAGTGQETALKLVADAGGTLAPAVAQSVAHRVWVRLRREPHTEETTQAAARWLAILVASDISSRDRDLLGYWLGECKSESDLDLALAIFEHLTHPSLRLKSSFARVLGESGGRSTDAQIDVPGDAHWLHEAWRKTLRPHLEVVADRLLPLVRAQLENAHSLLRATGSADSTWDPQTYNRFSIAPSNQDEHASHRPFNVLIEAGRDLIEWHLDHRPSRASAVIESWFRSSAPLVRRIGLYGLARDSGRSPSSRLDTVISMDWLGETRLRTELFDVLKRAYPEASVSCRRSFLAAASRHFLGSRRVGHSLAADAEREDELGSSVYKYFDLVSWINECDPECGVALERLEKLKEFFPQFKRDDSSLDDRSTGGWVGTESPLTAEELVSLGPNEYFLELERIRTEAPPVWPDLNDPVRGFLLQTSRATELVFSWSFALAEHLAAREEWEEAVWEYLIRGWGEADLDLESWESLLTLVLRCRPLLETHASGLGTLLWERFGKKPGQLDEAFIPLGVALAAEIWTASAKVPLADIQNFPDWLTVAINHPTGKLAYSAVGAVSQLVRKHGPTWRAASTPLAALLDRMVERGESSALARVVLSAHLDFLFNADEEWARDNLVPLFDWSLGAQTAAQAWAGFLFRRSPNAALWTDLKPHVVASYEHLGDLGQDRGHFAEFVGSACAFLEDDPITGLRILEYLKRADTADRVTFARRVASILSRGKPEANALLWRLWLSPYIQARLDGTPPLGSEEWNVMVQWPIYLEHDFPDAVESILKRQVTTFQYESVFHELAEHCARLTSNADWLARYLLHLLDGVGQHSWEWDDIGKVVGALIDAAAEGNLIRQILDRGAGLGWVRAGQLQKALTSSAGKS